MTEACRTTGGDALLAMARTCLDVLAADHPDIARRHRSQLVAHVDPLSGWGRLPDGELLPPAGLSTALTTITGPGGIVRLRPVRADDLTAHDLGRTTRGVSLPLRELLGALDGERCRFPGCTRRTHLHAHHVVHWSAAGPTDLANLVLLCSRHHTLVHQHGYQLALQPDRRLQVHTAVGTPVLHHPGTPWGDPTQLDPTGSVSAATATSTATDSRLDLGYVVSVLLQQAA